MTVYHIVYLINKIPLHIKRPDDSGLFNSDNAVCNKFPHWDLGDTNAW